VIIENKPGLPFYEQARQGLSAAIENKTPKN